MRDEQHVEGLQLPKRRGLHSSHSQPLPKLRRPRHRCAHTAHWKYMVRSQTRYASYRDIQRSLRKLPTGLFVASALWRQSFWKAYIPALYEVRKMRVLIGSSYHCMHCSWSDRRFMEERNKIHSFHTWEWIGGRQSGGKNDQRHDEGICTDFIFVRFNYIRWPDQHFIANRKQPSSISLLFWAVLTLCSV